MPLTAAYVPVGVVPQATPPIHDDGLKKFGEPGGFCTLFTGTALTVPAVFKPVVVLTPVAAATAPVVAAPRGVV